MTRVTVADVMSGRVDLSRLAERRGGSLSTLSMPDPQTVDWPDEPPARRGVDRNLDEDGER